MAHFYAKAQGSRGETHRLGGKSSGADVEVRGWHDGVRVWARYDEEKNRNIYEVDFTGGSIGSFSKKICTLEKDGNKIIYKPIPRSLNGKDDIIIDI